MKKFICMALGLICLALGAAGSMIPILPTVPFLLLAAVCFAHSSQKLHRWFVGTKLYRSNLADFAAGRGMTLKVKIRIMVTVTFLMSVGCIMMGIKGIVTGCVLLGVVWLSHLVYFIFGIKTVSDAEATPA